MNDDKTSGWLAVGTVVAGLMSLGAWFAMRPPRSDRKLSDEKIKSFLESHPGWTKTGDALTRTFSFDDYVAGIAFVVKVGAMAEEHNHHPDINVGWQKVTVSWSTHDAGGITAQDTVMAEHTDTIFKAS